MSNTLNGGQVFFTGGTAEGIPAGSTVVINMGPWPYGVSDNFGIDAYSTFNTAQLNQMLSTAQQVRFALMSGANKVSLSYAQGDGTKAIEYQPASLPNLNMLIGELQMKLGVAKRIRRPLRFIHR